MTELTEDLFQPSLAVICRAVPICEEWSDGHPELVQEGTVWPGFSRPGSVARAVYTQSLQALVAGAELPHVLRYSVHT